VRLHPAETARDFLDRGWWSGDTFDELLRQRVAAAPDAPAVADPPNTQELIGRDPVRWTWAELDAEVDRLAAVLFEHGVRAEDVVAVQLPNCSVLVAAFLAVVRLGAIVTPFPVSYREHELTGMCARTKARVLVTVAEFGGRSLAAAALTAGVPTVLALANGALPAGVLALPEGPAPTAAVREYVGTLKADPNDCVTICWTSGTEAEPKGVPRCHGDWLVLGEGTGFAADLGPEDVLLSPFPMTNMAGISGMFLPWLKVGGLFVPHHPFSLPVYLEQIQRERVTYTVAPPALLTVLLRDESILEGVDISSVRLIGSGSAPLSPWLVRTWAERHRVDVINFFGSNEGIALLSDPRDFPNPEDRARYFPHYGSDRAWQTPVAPRTRVRLTDLETGAAVTEPGRPGELRITGPSICAGYLADDPAQPLLRTGFDQDGYFRTGDVFELAGDQQQYLLYVDRAKDLVIRGGMNISPAELEGLLAGAPGVADVAVIGVPDEVLGERVCAVVVAAPDGPAPTLDGLLAHLRDRRIASFKLPERLEIVAALPRNTVGKILKRALREQFPA
jgi:acyl-CoA synthetase (AMP-forming)/AMP-acid ligase II